ncbi:CAP domain-containing protein [Streptomyces sp. NPDC001852]|uniref:CAP domain-containing protein n=1 Tax=Streptomyces sp. NPDC001852 TaxID=3364619 RepID=UPI0036B023FF
MGRHRRSTAGRSATGRATRGTHTQRSVTGGGVPQGSFAGEAWQGSFAGEAWQDPFAGEAWQDPYQGGARREPYPGEIVRRGRTEIVRREQAPRGIAPYLNPELHFPATGLQPMAYAEATARAHAYLFAAEHDGAGGSGAGGFAPADGLSSGHRRRRKGARPVRAGLLGVSVAVALGTAAVATGVIPGLQNYRLGGDTHTTGDARLQAVPAPSNTAAEQGGASGSADDPTGSGTGHASGPSRSPSPSAPSPSASASRSASPSASPTPTPSQTATGTPTPRATASAPSTEVPSATASKAPRAGSAPVAVSKTDTAAAETEVLRLVNEERAKVGCSALTTNSSLTRLAESFSDDMAARDFFDHTDPDGRTPWDRAAAAGITDLGGENIARGQADAAAVMQAWMDSPGHRANILNCDFKTLGVGVHFGPGGPWWTQDFGY